MPNESDKQNSAGRHRPTALSAEVKTEVQDLMSALLDERITHAQRQRLETLVVADQAVADLCMTVMHLSCSLTVHLLLHEMTSEGLPGEEKASGSSLMHETLIVPGIREMDFSEEEIPPSIPSPKVEVPLPAPIGPANTTLTLKKQPGIWFWGSAAAALLICIITIWTFMPRGHGENSGQTIAQNAEPNGTEPHGGQNIAPKPVAMLSPATISATVAMSATDPDFASPGAVLAGGRSAQLNAGAVELTFASGAVAVIKGPARFEVIDKNTIALADGSMTAHVPAAAIGFRVNSPGLAVIDRGTDFGVHAFAGNGSSEVHVFGGRVDVLALDKSGNPISDPVRLVANQAYRHDSNDLGAPVSVAFAPQGFTRDISSIREPIRLHSTGAGFGTGSLDLYWRLVSAPAELNWSPQQALVISDTGYVDSRNSPDAKWISIGKDGTSSPDGDYVFRTRVDLSGFDPATVLIEARVTADDWVSDIRVNGVSTGLSTRNIGEVQKLLVPATLKFSGDLWKSGVNQVDVVVHNKVMAGEGLNPTGLQLRWSGTGCPLVKR